MPRFISPGRRCQTLHFNNMFSYQHHYHAGNHADVLKHWLLLACVRYLQRKEKPFDYIDTHAGPVFTGWTRPWHAKRPRAMTVF